MAASLWSFLSSRSFSVWVGLALALPWSWWRCCCGVGAGRGSGMFRSCSMFLDRSGAWCWWIQRSAAVFGLSSKKMLFFFLLPGLVRRARLFWWTVVAVGGPRCRRRCSFIVSRSRLALGGSCGFKSFKRRSPGSPGRLVWLGVVSGNGCALDAAACSCASSGGDRGWQQPGIGKIRVDRALNRACRVVGLVTLCTPNGYGDLILNLKDPSGTIDASVHKKVLSNEILSKGLSVGSVIVLKQVAVLRPSSTVCYLNVTQKNVEKVLQNDSVSPCKQAVPSSNSERQSQQPGQGDNMEKEAGADTSDGMAAILSKLSRTKDGRIVDLLCDNGGAAKAVNSSTLRTDKDTHSVQNHHEKRVEQMDSSSQIKNLAGFNTSQQLQKIISSMNPANCQPKGGSIPKYGISSEAESSADDIMRKLTGGEMMVPSSKEITVAKGSRRNCGTHDASNNTSRLDGHTRRGSEKPQGIGLQKMVEDHSREHVSNTNRDEHQQQNPGADTRCTQPILGGSSVMAGSRDCTQASCTGNLRQLSGDESMQPRSKKLKSDAMLSDDNGLDGIAGDFLGGHNSIRKPEHQQRDIHGASAGTLQPTQENCSISATGGTLPSSQKMVSVASVPEWTDEQLSQLFDDY